MTIGVIRREDERRVPVAGRDDGQRVDRHLGEHGDEAGQSFVIRIGRTRSEGGVGDDDEATRRCEDGPLLLQVGGGEHAGATPTVPQRTARIAGRNGASRSCGSSTPISRSRLQSSVTARPRAVRRSRWTDASAYAAAALGRRRADAVRAASAARPAVSSSHGANFDVRQRTGDRRRTGPEAGTAYARTVLVVGLTGGIGSGKSTVSAMLAEKGALVIDADAITRELQQPGHRVFDAMVERFGPGIVADDGTLDRPAVAAIVFTDEQAEKGPRGDRPPRGRGRDAQQDAGRGRHRQGGRATTCRSWSSRRAAATAR